MSEIRDDLRKALAYLTPHPATKGPVILDPVKMRSAVSALQAEVERLQKVEGERDATLSALKGLLREILPTSPDEPYTTPGWAAVERSVRTLADLDERLRSVRLTETKEGSEHV